METYSDSMQQKCWEAFSESFNDATREELVRFPKLNDRWMDWQDAWKLGIEAHISYMAVASESNTPQDTQVIKIRDRNGNEIKAGDVLYNRHDLRRYHTVLQDDNGHLFLGDFDSPLERYTPHEWWEVVNRF